MDERLRALEYERQMLTQDLEDLRFSFTKSREHSLIDRGMKNSAIQRIITKQKELYINKEEQDSVKENIDRKGDFEMKYYIENIRDLSKTNLYLEDQIGKQEETTNNLVNEKRIIKDRLEKHEKLKEMILEERNLLLNNKDMATKKLIQIEDDIDKTKLAVKKAENNLDKAGYEKERIRYEIKQLEEQLRLKKLDLNDILSDINEKENQLKTFKTKIEDLLEEKTSIDDKFKFYDNKLSHINGEKESLEINYNHLKNELSNKESYMNKVNNERKENYELLNDFKELKNRYLEKFDKLSDKRSDVYDSVLSDKSKIINIERQTNERIEKARQLFA